MTRDEEPASRKEETEEAGGEPVEETGDQEDSSSAETGEVGSDSAKERPKRDTEETGPDPDDSEPPFPRPDFTTLRIRMFNFSCFFYVLMGIGGLFWMNAQGIMKARLLPARAQQPLYVSLLSGAGVAGIVVIGGTIIRRFSDWAREFEREFAPLLNVFSYAQVPIVAFLSAAGEEILFRGALQESIGLIPSAVLFGLVHLPWSRKMIPWPLFAFGMGLIFGYMVEATGSLYGPIIGHLIINLLNISLIKIRHPMKEEEVLDEILPS